MKNFEELQRIEIRRQIKNVLEDAMRSAQEGNTTNLKSTLDFIHNEFKNGFTVHKKLDEGEGFTDGLHSYRSDDKVIAVKDGHSILVGFYRCKTEGRMKMHFDDYMLLTNEEKDFMMSEAVKHSKAVFYNLKSAK